MTSIGSWFLVGNVQIKLISSPKMKLIYKGQLQEKKCFPFCHRMAPLNQTCQNLDLTPAWCSWDSFGLQLPPSCSWWGPPALEVQARGRMQTGAGVVTPQTNPIHDHRRKFSNDKTLSRWRQEDSNHLKLHWPNSLGKMFLPFFQNFLFFTQNYEMHLHLL